MRASVPDAEGTSVSLKIEVTGKCSIEEDTVQSVQVGEEAIWNLAIEDDSVFVRVVRTDTDGCAFMTLKIYESVSGIYEAKGVWDGSVLNDEGPEPLTDWRARVVQTGSDMTITFLNNSGTVLTGTYDEITGVFVGMDLHTPENALAATWWMQDYTTITFDFDSNPMTAKGKLYWNWEEQTENHLFDWTKVDFDMLKVEELPQ